MPEKNYFGIETRYNRGEGWDKDVFESLNDYFRILFAYLRIRDEERKELAPQPVYYLDGSKPEKENGFFTPNQRTRFLELAGGRLIEGLRERSNAVVKYIWSYMDLRNVLADKKYPERVYDNGAGDKGNSVALRDTFKSILGQKLEVIASDVVQIPGVQNIAPDIPWVHRPAGQMHRLPNGLVVPNGYFDICLNVVNLHHSQDPLYELAESARVTNGKIIVVETLANMAHKDFPEWFLAKEHYPVLSREHQSLFAGLVDIAQNGLFLGPEVPVPCNFADEKTWKDVFEMMGLHLIDREFVGYDNSLIREPHICFVLESHGRGISPERLLETKREMGIAV